MTSPAVINLTFDGQKRGEGGLPDLTGQFLDPAQQVLLEIEEKQKQRKRDETRHELERIQGRIGYALEDYDSHPQLMDHPPEDDDISFELLENPEELYELLSDSRTRSKYQQSVMVYIVGYEEKCENREQLLQSLQDFFQETQAGNTQKVLEEIASEEIDFEAATGGLESALETAQSAAQRLLEIKREMGQLVAVVAAFPDTKKGRKKMEKALLKAQDEVHEMGSSLQTMRTELKQTSDRCQQLQQQVEAKGAECARLRKAADQVKTMQLTIDSLKAELGSMQSSLKRAQADLEKAQSAPAKEVVREVVRVDEARVKELEASLARERETVQQLTAEKAEWEGQQGAELEALKVEHEAELQEMRDRYEEQLRSLAVDDEFGEAVSDLEEGSTHEVEEAETVEAAATEPPEREASPEGQERGGAQPLASGSYVQQLKAQQEEREKKLQDELSDLKTKSRKTVTALRAQLAEAQNRHSSEVQSLRGEVSSLGDQARELDQRNAMFQEEIGQLQEAKQSAEMKLERSLAGQQEQQAMIQQLRQELSNALAQAAAATVTDDKTITVPGLVDRSAQWSELSGQSPPVSQGASPLYRSMVLPPMLPMDEVLHDEPVSTMTTPFQTTPLQASFRLTSLDQSVMSLEPPCGSPLQPGSEVSDMPRLPQHSLSMLGRQSRLSHQSPFPQVQLSFDHPIVTEWTKVYDMVMRFRDGLVAMFTESGPSLAALVEDLQTMEVYQMDRSQEVQGQITQMRFSLTLLLHQMEQTLGEGLARVGGAAPQEDSRVEQMGKGAELKETVTQLQRKLRQSEETHLIELQDSKETIANLSSKVESLRMELAALRHSMPQPNEGEGTIMFTRLDSERNTRTLKDALERERLSPSTFEKVASGMEQYLSIPSCRLAHMSRRYKEKAVASRLIQHVWKSYSNTEQVAKIVGEISGLEEKRKLEFSLQMDKLSAQRLDLARSLTHSLGLIEKTAGVFLIKPVFAPKGAKPHNLITPIVRALPTRKPVSRPRTVQGLHPERGFTPHLHSHPSMRLVSGLLHSRQTQRTEQRIEGSTNVSGRATPHPAQRGGAQSSSPEWRVDASRPLAEATPTPPPSIPRLVELEVSRYCQTEALLGRLLPGRPQRQATPTQPSWRSSSPPKTRLAPLEETSQQTIEPEVLLPLPLTATPAPLPPIRVPSSRMDGRLAVT